MAADTIEDKAQSLADGLGIPFYIRDGRVWQHGPGQVFLPSPTAKPVPHGVDGLKGETPAAS